MSDGTSLKNVMILDDDADFRKLLVTILGKKFTDVKLIEHDPVSQGVPGDNFDWSRVDVLLLDYHLSIPRVTGLDILQNNRKNKLFPATIMLTGAGNEEIAVRAVKAGVYDYLRKETLDKDRLYSTILRAYEEHQEERNKLNELTSQSHAFNKALFYQELEQKDKDKTNRVLIFIELDKHENFEKKFGIIFRDNIIRHIAKQSFEVFKMGETNPSITRFGDTSVAMLIDEPKSRNILEFNLEGLCGHLEKHPYKFNDKKIPATVSIGALCLSDKKLNAEEYIKHALNAAKKASLEEGDSFYLYGEPDWAAVNDQLDVREISSTEKPVIYNTQTETSQAAEPVAKLVSTPADKIEIVEKPPIREEIVQPTPPVVESVKDEIQPGPVNEPTIGKDKTKPDPKELGELMLKIKTAFEEKRAVQTFQQVIPLTQQENDQEMYIVAVQLINKDGSIMAATELNKVTDMPVFRKFIDRWMLREIIGRIASRVNEKYDFFVNISADSIADATFFNWLRKLLKGLDKNNPGKQIIFEISANEISNIQKQAMALISFFKKSHGFRFSLSQVTNDQEVLNLSKTMQIDFLRDSFETISRLNTTFLGPSTNTNKISMLQQLKNNGVHIITDDVEDATKLTDTITLGADYATGLFIGEPVNQLDDVTNVERFEII